MASKLIKNIRARMTGQRGVVVEPMSIVETDIRIDRQTAMLNYTEEFRADVRLGAYYKVSNLEIQQNPAVTAEVPTHILRAIAYEVYGEIEHELQLLMPHICEARSALPETGRHLEEGLERIFALCRP